MLVLLVSFLLLLSLLSHPAAADPAMVITADTTLTADVTGGIVVGANGITLDCAGHTITGDGSGVGIDLTGRSGITVKNCNVTNFGFGFLLFGFPLSSSFANTLTGNTANHNGYGIRLFQSSGNTLTANTANGNKGWGIILESSYANTLTGNTANGNRFGIILDSYSSGNTLTGNTANGNRFLGRDRFDNNGFGIRLSYSGGNTLTGNTMSGNQFNFGVSGGSDSDFDNDIDRTNTLNGRPIFYVKNANGQTFDASTNAGTFYCVNCAGVMIKDLDLSKNGVGLFLWRTRDSHIESIQASNNVFGIHLSSSSNNTLTANTANNNALYGFALFSSSNNNVLRNEACGNGLFDTFISSDSTGNVFADNQFCTTSGL